MNIIEIKLKKATISDAQELFEIQIKSFLPMLKKYEDYKTNPGNGTIEGVMRRIKGTTDANNAFYKIMKNEKTVGAIDIWWENNKTKFNVGILFISPEYQGEGVAQTAITEVEELYTQAASWHLNTILEEKKNCYLYEKMGYTRYGVEIKLNEKTTLIFYQKTIH